MDYILCWRTDLQNVQDSKVLPREAVAKQHKSMVCKVRSANKEKRETGKIQKSPLVEAE